MQHSKMSMALSAVSLRDLTLVQAVARACSFTAAARQMHISPSGLSHQVQKVEQALDTPIFERGGRRILPTAAGRRLLERIDAVLAAAERLDQASQLGATAFGGQLRLGVPATLGPYLLPQLIEPFPRHFPGVQLALSEGKLRGLMRRLSEGELDAVLAPPAPPMAGVTGTAMFFEPYALLLNASHALAGQATVALERLRPEDARAMAEGHDADMLDVRGGAGEDRQVQDVSLESLATLVLLHGGYALVPSLARQRLGSIPRLALADIEGEPPGREIHLYWRQAWPWQDDAAAFGDLIRSLAAQLDGLRVID